MLTKIPLNTFYPYYVDESGRVYREEKEIGQWKHYPPRRMGGGPYTRCRLKMKDGSYGLFFVQRLMGMAFYGLKRGEIMRHGPSGTCDNSKGNLATGTHKENQAEDRLSQGTYFSRGAAADPLLNEFATRLSEDVGF